MSWNESDIPELSGRTMLITGANSGVGFEAAKVLVEKGAHVIMACRDRDAAEAAKKQILSSQASGSAAVFSLDLADLDSVAACAEQLLGAYPAIDVLINNAGVMGGAERFTEQGFEMQMGTNHLGHFALTAAIWPLMRASDSGRVVSLSSLASRSGALSPSMTRELLVAPDPYKAMNVYSNTKQATLLFSQELARLCAAAEVDVASIAVHPGVSSTNLFNRQLRERGMGVLVPVASGFGKLALQSAKSGALPTIRAAVDPEIVSGDFLGPAGIGQVRGAPKKVDLFGSGKNPITATRLWKLSEEIVELPFDVSAN